MWRGAGRAREGGDGGDSTGAEEVTAADEGGWTDGGAKRGSGWRGREGEGLGHEARWRGGRGEERMKERRGEGKGGGNGGY